MDGVPAPEGHRRPDLAARQAELVAALVAGGGHPAGFDPGRLDATRHALLRKRAAQAAVQWPLLAAAHGADWAAVFGERFHGVEPTGALREGWDLARELSAAGTLPGSAAAELTGREAALRYDGHSAPRRRSRAASALHRLRRS